MFRVSPDCLNLGLRAAAIVFRSVQITPSGAELRAEIDSEVNRVRHQYTSLAEVRAT